MSEFLYVNGRLKRTQEQQVSGDMYMAYSSDIDYNNSNYNVHNVQEAINKLFEEIESLKNNNPNPPVEKYTVTFKSNGGIGTTPSSITVNSGSSISLPGSSGLTKEGYTFDNWNENSEGTGTKLHEGDSYTVTKNTTLYAIWVKDTTSYCYYVDTTPPTLSNYRNYVSPIPGTHDFTNLSGSRTHVYILVPNGKTLSIKDKNTGGIITPVVYDETLIPDYIIYKTGTAIANRGEIIITLE